MTDIALIGFGLGAFAAIAAVLLLTSTGLQQIRPGGRSKLLAGVAFAVPLVALVAYTTSSNNATPDELLEGASPMAASTGSALGEGDWSLMAHVYMGGPPPGSTAGNAASTGAPASSPHTVDELRKFAASEPGNAQVWLALARAQRQARDFQAAVTSYDKALKLDAGNPDAWADYADALASAGNRRLEGAPAAAIARALKLDGRHPKALWLQASLDLEQHRYAEALARWQELRAALPAGSPDIAIVEANINEARELVAQASGAG